MLAPSKYNHGISGMLCKHFSSITKDTFQIVIIVWYYCCLIGAEKQSIELRTGTIFVNA